MEVTIMKNKKIIMSAIVNITLAALYMSLNVWALRAQLEETFVFLAASYGALSLICNLAIVSIKEKE